MWKPDIAVRSERVLIRPLLTALILVGASEAAPAISRGNSSCPSSGVLARSAEAVLYRTADDDLAACVRSTGKRDRIGTHPIRGLTKLRGTVATWAELACVSEGCDETGILIYARDVAKPSGFDSYNIGGGVLPGLAKVGSIRANRQLDLAWIECPSHDKGGWPDPKPDCVRAGGGRNVVAKRIKGSGTSNVRLDAGPGIDPSSLRLRGSTLTWRKNGRRRTAAL